jgi:hypothetical protein
LKAKLLFTLAVTCCSIGYSQGIYNNGAIINITSGAYVHIDGDANGGYLNLTSISNGSIDLNGTLEVEGNWINNASGGTVLINTAPANGAIILTGNTNTAMGGTRTTQFENLTINKAAAGNTVSLSSAGTNETILGALTFSLGKFTTNANFIIVTNTASASLTGYNSNSFINGNLRRYITGGVASYFFPVGDGTVAINYHIAEIANHTLTGVTYINSSFSSLTQAGMTLTELASPYLQSEGRWLFTPDANPAGGSFDMKLYKINLPGANYIDNQFAIVQRDLGETLATDWDCIPCGIGTPGLNPNGGIGRLTADAFALRKGMTFTSTLRNQFAIGTLTGPLPIELISFTASCLDNEVELDWITASEENNDYFTVEKSTDAINFYTIATVNGAGNSNTTIHYSATDPNPEASATNYYRLKQTDYNGSYTYSNIVSAQCTDEVAFDIVNITNTNNTLLIYISGAEGEEYRLYLYDDNGKLISNISDHLYASMNVVTINIGDISPGIYMLSLSNSQKHLTKKIILGTNSY